MSGRRLRVRTVRPELGQHAGVVAARHDLRRVGFAGGRVELVARSRIATVRRVVERRIVLETPRIFLDVAQTRRGDVHRHAVARIQVRRPLRHQRVRPAVVVSQRAVDGGRRARIVVEPVVEVVAPVHRPVLRAQREWHHDAPLRTEELGIFGYGVTRLVDEGLEFERLPPVQIHDVRIAWQVGFQRWIDRFVAHVRVVVRFVGAVGVTEVDVALPDTVAERGGLVVTARVVSECAHERIGIAANQAGPGRDRESMPDDAVSREAHCPSPGALAGVLGIVDGRRLNVASDPGAFTAEQPRLGGVVEGCPNVVHRRGDMEQVAGMHRRPRVVVPDRLQKHFVPAPGNGHVVGHGDSGRVVRDHGDRVAWNDEDRFRRPGVVEAAAAVAAPVAEVVVFISR